MFRLTARIHEEPILSFSRYSRVLYLSNNEVFYEALVLDDMLNCHEYRNADYVIAMAVLATRRGYFFQGGTSVLLYFSVLLGTSRYFSVLLGTSRYFSVLLRTSPYFFVLLRTSILLKYRSTLVPP